MQSRPREFLAALPQDVAVSASDDSSYSTGSEFIVDGGWNAGMRVDLLPGA